MREDDTEFKGSLEAHKAQFTAHEWECFRSWASDIVRGWSRKHDPVGMDLWETENFEALDQRDRNLRVAIDMNFSGRFMRVRYLVDGEVVETAEWTP